MAVENGAAAALFSEEELRDVSGVRLGDGFVEVTCGCTSARYGDAVGRLRVFASGELEVSCECTPGCTEDKLSPAAFEKHSGRETAGKWQNTVWAVVKGDKVALSKTGLLRHYHSKNKKLRSRSANGSGGNGRHRDEFVRCSGCGKERRFRLRTKEECRLHHDAAARHDWTCKDMDAAAAGRVRCEDEEERASRKASRGCARAAACKGCVRCVCFGCETCRFAGCGCQTCVDFYRNHGTTTTNS
ncbi:protein ULTRAPETALA 1-like [Oryza brachyantha]|uniref:SAND domain-containing protein n=1 Tax=Oryza brachyantha TaxID=4533 RepID=J3M8N2_ORYBR|nr:protein ULTRAPETALA 1-like [Oryza brachyantha]